MLDLKTLTSWLEDRTGLPGLARQVMDRPIRGGARWGHALGFALAATVVVDLVTGLLLMTTYSPSTTMAWGSVYYITYGMELGWFVRGMHRLASSACVILGGLFLFRLVVAGAYRAPREVHWWLAVGAFLLILGLGVTGNILPWDQRGYWAAVVETTIAGGTPVLGPMIKKLIVGGSEAGNQTITRFYGLHVAVLPGLLVVIGWAYAVLFGKSGGYHHRDESAAAEPYWPRQALYDFAAAAGVVGILAGLTLAWHGYSLDAPADPSSEDYPARPEWYFLPLNLLLHVFEGKEYIATMLIPGGVVTGLFLLPLLEKVLPRRLAYVAACTFLVTVAGAAAVLVGVGIDRDSKSPAFQAARAKADESAKRAVLLATRDGIPPEGSSYLLGLDPESRGRQVYAQKCAGCHPGFGGPGEGSAPHLAGFGGYRWVRGLLEKPDAATYYGHAPQCDGMSTWKESSKLDAKGLDEVAAFVATFAEIPPDVTPAEWQLDPRTVEHPGRKAFQKECATCHTMGDPSIRDKMMQPAPDLFAWGSSRWTARMIQAPDSIKHYGYLEAEQKMPAFAGQLTDRDVDTVVRLLRGE